MYRGPGRTLTLALSLTASFGVLSGAALVAGLPTLNGVVGAFPGVVAVLFVLSAAGVGLILFRLKEEAAAAAAEAQAQKEAELSLRRREEHFRALVERAPDVIAILSPEGTVRYGSPSVATALGYRPDDSVGKSILRFAHPDDAPVFLEALAEVAQNPGPGRAREFRFRHRDGSWRVLETLLERMTDASGTEVVVLYSRDITERKQAEEALRVSEERYALAASGANDGLWDWDLRSDRIFYSPRWISMVGCEADEVGDRPKAWFNRVHPEDLGRVQAEITSHVEGRAPRFETEYRLQRKDGAYRWMLVRGLAVRDGEGKAYRMAGSQTDISDRKAAEDLLLHQAIHDALTGLPNRASFIDRLDRSLARTRRSHDYVFAVLFLDLDRFKLVNDSLGHLSGDQLLVSVARRLSSCLRPGDLVAHVGGDEFTLLVDHITGLLDATTVAGRVQRALAQPFTVGGQDVFASASVGIALSGTGYERPEEMLRDADTAMYRAKAQGSGRYEVFDKYMHARALDRLQLETDLRRAVERKEFEIHYQPIVSLASGLITGFEALVRWQHPRRGLVSPVEFIPVAEETGLIIPICLWVLREACRQAREWQERFAPAAPLSMSMNLTSTHFTESDVIDGIEEALRVSGLDGRQLALEITESVMMKDIDAVVAVLRALKSMEIELHIDDFGTGYSSLSYLHSLPTDALKIDRSFVGRMGKGDDGAIVRTIIEMAHNFGSHVIAEGIETEAQLGRLRALGCEYGQGFYFSRPLVKEQAESLVASRPKW